MSEVCRRYGEDTYLWMNYIGFRVLNATETEFGSYEPKVCISVGEKLKPRKEIEETLKTLDEKRRNKLLALAPKVNLKEFIEKKESTFFDRLKFVLKRKYHTLKKYFGVQEKTKVQPEYFHFVKFSKIEDYENVLLGAFSLYGALGKLNKMDKDTMKKSLRKQFKRFLVMAERGYEKA